MAYSTLRSKLVAERITVTFNFTSDLSPLEIITSQEVVIEVLIGEDPAPEELLYQVASTDGQIVNQQIHAGIPGVIYQLICTAITDLGQTVTKISKLAILPTPIIIPDIYGIRYTTKLYPLEHAAEITNAVSFESGRLRPMPFPVEYMTQEISFISGILRDLLIEITATDESIQHDIDFISGTLRDLLILIDAPEESITTGVNFVDGELRDIVIEYSPLPETIQHSISFISGTLT